MWKWYVFQGLVMFAVIASNIHWQWTPNGLLAGIIGYGVAFVLTCLFTGTISRKNMNTKWLIFARRGHTKGLVGLKDDTSRGSPGLLGTTREISEPPQQWSRPRISQDVR